MFWPLVLPFQITCVALGVVVLLVTGWAPKLKWKRGKAFAISALLAVVAFVPSCTSVWYVLDEVRFGYFEYATFDGINDFRAERYMPPMATDIQMYKHKHGNGTFARYAISEMDFRTYFDDLWKKYGELSVAERAEVRSAYEYELEPVCAALGCEPPLDARCYRSPTEPDGGGANYYVDSESGFVLQDTGYW